MRSPKESWRLARSVLRTVLDDPSNDGQRLGRVARAFAWQAWRRLGGAPLILTLDNGLEFIADPASGNSVGAIYTRIYEAKFVEFLRRHVTPGGFLCDVGAHAGLYTLLLAPLFRAGRCYEPATDTLRLLRRNLGLNGLITFLDRPVAVSSRAGTARLAAAHPYDGGAHLLDDARKGGTEQVETVTLDDELKDVRDLTLLKIDTEGHEAEVLRGARVTLERHPRALVLYENQLAEGGGADAFLRSIGWKVFAIDGMGTPTTDRKAFRLAHNLFSCGPEHPLFGSL